MNENEFILGSLTLVAKKVEGDICEGCRLEGITGCIDMRSEGITPQCSSRFRQDKQNVIFVEKQ